MLVYEIAWVFLPDEYPSRRQLPNLSDLLTTHTDVGL